MRRQALLLDLGISVGLLYLSFWIYELSNYVVLSILGSQTSLAFEGILPTGVTAALLPSWLVLASKPFQVLLSAAAMFGLFKGAQSQSLPLSAATSLTVLSLYLVSPYWETFSLVGTISYGAHLTIFSGLAIGARLGLGRFLRV